MEDTVTLQLEESPCLPRLGEPAPGLLAWGPCRRSGLTNPKKNDLWRWFCPPAVITY
jgi:hypothetical protein